MPALPQFDYLFAIGTIFAFLDAWNIGMEPYLSLMEAQADTLKCQRCCQLLRDLGRFTLAHPQASHVHRLRDGVRRCHACWLSCH